MKTLSLSTNSRNCFVDITKDVQLILDKEDWEDGVLTIFSPHTTGGITLNENWDPDVQHDLLLKMNEVFADDPRFKHSEGNSDAHLKTSLFGPSQAVIIKNGKLQIGQWQGVYFVEWDGPRNRKVFLQFVSS